jgi:ribosomal protein S18 acetylase RimI-like enzyme
VRRFWGDEKQLTFDREFLVTTLPAFSAKVGNDIIGFISFSEINDVILIVALGVLPKYQNAGVGKSLIGEVEAEARRLGKKKLLVSTSNDDLPALAFYQSLGFQIFEVKNNVIANKHGKILKGVCGLPIRDELRLQKILP